MYVPGLGARLPDSARRLVLPSFTCTACRAQVASRNCVAAAFDPARFLEAERVSLWRCRAHQHVRNALRRPAASPREENGSTLVFQLFACCDIALPGLASPAEQRSAAHVSGRHLLTSDVTPISTSAFKLVCFYPVQRSAPLCRVGRYLLKRACAPGFVSRPVTLSCAAPPTSSCFDPHLKVAAALLKSKYHRCRCGLGCCV